MKVNLIKIYRFFEPILKIAVGLLVNRLMFAILEKLASVYIFLIFCMALIFYMKDRLDMTLTFVGVACLINFILKYMDNNIWKIEMWSKDRHPLFVIQKNPSASSRIQKNTFKIN